MTAAGSATPTPVSFLSELIVMGSKVKGDITRFNIFLNKYRATHNLNLEHRLEMLPSSFKEFIETQIKIELLINEDAAEEQKAAEEREKFENDYFEVIAKARDLIAAYKADLNSM